MVVWPGAANIQPMIGVDNQAGVRPLVWLERTMFGAGALGVLALGIQRQVSGEALAYPQSLLWIVPCAALAAGCALLYWRVATRTPQ
ncbi:hypothetical protein [Glycocaulis sp.]|uniref:hypothetical protein n=1 Tax=Glycocaulis sp. TaxID=1969725 RepID=UPI003D1CD45B